MIDERPSGVPDTEVIDLEASSPSREEKEIIQHLRAENDALQRRFEGAQWTITYLEQRNKQLEEEKALDELWRIRSDRILNRRRPGDPLPADRESMLIQANAHLERLLAKANQEKEHEKSLLGADARVQGKDESASKTVGKGTKMEKKARSPPYLGRGFLEGA